MNNYYINDRRVSIPTNHNEVTFKDFVGIKDKEGLEIVSYFTGLTVEQLEKGSFTWQYSEIVKDLSFLNKKAPNYKKPVLYKGRVIPELPESIAKFEAARAMIQNELKDEEFPEFINKWLSKGNESEVKDIWLMPYTQVIGLANFFLNALLSGGRGTLRSALVRRMNRMKSKLVFWRLKGSDLLTRFYNSLRKTLKGETSKELVIWKQD